MDIHIVHMNLYAGNNQLHKALDAAFKGNPDVIGFNEAYKWVDNGEPVAVRAKREDYRLFFGEDKRDLRRGFKDNPVLVRHDLKDLGNIAILGCDASTPEKIAPLRGINCSLFGKGGRRIAYMNLHPHAAVDGKDAKEVDRAKQYGIFWQHVDEMVDALQHIGYDPILGGDFNLPSNGHVKNAMDPWEVLRKHGYVHMGVDLDHVAWNPKRWKPASNPGLWIIRKEAIGSDHDGLTVKLEHR